MNPDIARIIRRTTYATVVLGVVLSPIPLADEILLLPAYGLLTLRIANAHRLSAANIPWRPIARTALAGLGARAAVNITVSYIPFVAAAANAASAAALTQIFGRYVDEACRDPKSARPVTARELLQALRAMRPTKAPAPA